MSRPAVATLKSMFNPMWQLCNTCIDYRNPRRTHKQPMSESIASHFHLFLLLLVLAPWFPAPPVGASPQGGAAVRAVLFYSPTCPHCHKVIRETLEPMAQEYAESLRILAVDVRTEDGRRLYQQAVERFHIGEDRLGVPTLIVADTVLVGDHEIPDVFPGLVTDGLAMGGIDWPDLPNLKVLLAGMAETAPGGGASDRHLPDDGATPHSSLVEIAVADPPPEGAALAWGVLMGMSAALLVGLWRILRRPMVGPGRMPPDLSRGHWLLPLLAVLGAAISGYLAYVEVVHVSAVCGPVGDCNAVQASPYARIAGIPVAVLGLLYYFSLVALWGAPRFGKPSPLLAGRLLAALSLFGVAFSVYLTLLELFVIRAVCMWCLSSAVVATLFMLWVVVPLTRGVGKEIP